MEKSETELPPHKQNREWLRANRPGENDKWVFYKEDTKQFRWRRVAPNGNKVGNPGEPYHNKLDCWENAWRLGCDEPYYEIIWEE